MFNNPEQFELFVHNLPAADCDWQHNRTERGSRHLLCCPVLAVSQHFTVRSWTHKQWSQTAP